jgi:tetratricopeptide (TPR) repeat protein
VGIELRFCKHCVAVSLAWTAADAGITPDLVHAAPGSRARSDPDGELRSFLAGQSREALVGMLLEHASESRRLRTRLELRAAAGGARPANPARFRHAIDRAFRTDGFVEYARMPSYAKRILDVIGELRPLLDTAPAVLVELMKHAAGRAQRAVADVDDSDGYFSEIFATIGELHLEACQRARPDPVPLARWLFERELRDDYDVIGGVEAYAEVLGPSGLAEYRALAEAEWNKVPPLGPGEGAGADRTARFSITRIMEALARLEGGVEPLVEVRRRDLSHAYQFLKIAELYRDAGDSAQAVAWAEAGLAAFPAAPDGRLRTFLAGVHQDQGRHEEALKLVWAELSDHPGLDAYRQLKEHADRADAWPQWRERALALVRERADAENARRSSRSSDRIFAQYDGGGYSTLVRILLWESRVDEAWAAAGAGGCSEPLWFELARKREAKHPGDAIPIYRRHIESKVDAGSNQGYEDAVRLLSRLADLYARAGRPQGEFGDYVATLRNTYRRKRNFIKLLGASSLP